MELVSGCCMAPKIRIKSKKFGNAQKLDHFSSKPDKLLIFTTQGETAVS